MAVTARSLQLPESMTNGGMAVPDAGHDLVMLLTSHPVTIRIDAEPPGPEVPDDFAGLGFERGPLNPGNAGVAGYLFRPENDSLVTLFRNMGLRNLRLGGGSVDNMFPAGADGDFRNRQPVWLRPRGRTESHLHTPHAQSQHKANP